MVHEPYTTVIAGGKTLIDLAVDYIQHSTSYSLLDTMHVADDGTQLDLICLDNTGPKPWLSAVQVMSFNKFYRPPRTFYNYARSSYPTSNLKKLVKDSEARTRLDVFVHDRVTDTAHLVLHAAPHMHWRHAPQPRDRQFPFRMTFNEASAVLAEPEPSIILPSAPRQRSAL